MASTAPSPDAVLHLAALHTLASTGFASTSRAASLTLSSTLSRYLRLVATTCSEKATLAGRHKVAAIDIVEALEDLGVGGVGELHEWAVGLDTEVGFVGHGLESLGEAVREGLSVEEGIAEMKLVPKDEILEDEEEDVDEDEGDEEKMDVDVDDGSRDVKPIRFGSPDMSWLPPLPDGDLPQTTSVTITEEGDTGESVPITSLSIIDRYRRRIPFAQSQLGATRPFIDPPNPPLTKSLTAATSSLPALKSAFAATAGEPSVTMRQSALRNQAIELLRRNIAAPDNYSPLDTLTSYIPPPRSSPIIPSHSETVPPHFIPLNPYPSGLLSNLVHQMLSPYLPPALRERLTSVRPPQVQVRDNEPLLYGEPIHGPGPAALARARGKQVDGEEADEGLLRATWPVPPRGYEKWGKGKLPTGKKIVQSGVGEDKPRLPEGAIRAPLPSPAASTPIMAQPPGKIKLRLPGQGDGSASPGGVQAITNNTNSVSPLPPPMINTSSVSPAPPIATPTGGTGSGIRLKLGVRKESSEALPTPTNPNGIRLSLSTTPQPPAAHSPSPSLSLKLNTKSLSPMVAQSPNRDIRDNGANGTYNSQQDRQVELGEILVKKEDDTGRNGHLDNGDEALEESISAVRAVPY